MIGFTSRPKRKVPTPETIGPHRSENPLFNPAEPQPQYQKRILAITGGIVGAVGLSLVAIGPWWQISTITVSGVREINPKSVQTVVEEYVHKRHWLFIPNANLALFSTHAGERYLQKKIEERISVEQVVIEKIFPDTLHVAITERTPVAYVKTHDQLIAIDKHGTLIQEQAPEGNSLPIIEEETDKRIGQPVFSESVMSSVAQLYKLFQEASIETSGWVLPIVTCPVYVPPVKEDTNTNTGSDAAMANTNAVNSYETNTNGSAINVNTDTIENPFGKTCTDAELRQTRPEIHVSIKDGPVAQFDRFQPLAPAVQRVRRILAQPNPPKEYIDVRFGDRVFIK